jgi:hypothetical protein
MNLSILVTKKNIQEMELSALRMGEMQELPVNGAFCVFYDSTISKDKIGSIMRPISSKFPAISYAPVQINGSLTNDVQLAVLFGNLIIQAYSRFPGAWLVVDSLSIPLIKDFMQATERQHKANGGGITGRGVEGKGSILPVGPTVIDLPHRAIKFLRYPVSTSWRERGQFQFARCRFANISSSDYLWSLSENKCEPKQEKIDEPAQEDCNFDEWEKAQLMSYILKMSGRSPHPATGMTRLISTAKELSELALA